MLANNGMTRLFIRLKLHSNRESFHRERGVVV
jgi:hypothetical protein